MIKYLVPFLTSFFITAALIALAVFYFGKFKFLGRKSGRHIHKEGISRFGGVVMIIAFNLAILLNRDLFITSEIYAIMASSFILLAVGLWDDIKEIFWKVQLFFQVAVSALVFIHGIRIYYVTNPLNGGIINLNTGPRTLISIALVIFWIVLITNTINWLDGLDGLSGGVTLISALTIFALSLKSEVNQPPVAILALILSGTVLGFLVFNFFPAKIMAGTSGAMFMGFVLSALAIISGTKIATAILVMAVPIVDLFWVVGERIKNKKSIFIPDSRHLHYKLLKLGWPQKKIVFGYWIVTLIIASVALNTRSIGKGVTLIATFFIMLLVLIVIGRKIREKENSKA